MAVIRDTTHNPFDEARWVSCLRENLTSSSYGEGLETGRASIQVPRQSFTRQLMFKEWKSYASLHAFDTSKANIAEGLIWAALCAAILKRYCAHLAQRLWQVPISTRKVAMCLHHVLSDIFHALLHAQRHLQKTLQRALHYLSLNAQRAHPKRDQLSGRLKLSLQHVYAGP